MNVGATRMMMDTVSRRSVRDPKTESAEPTSANTCSDVPLDNARPVAGETNPPTYWPPPSLPSMNFFEEAGGGDTRAEGPERETSLGGEVPKFPGRDPSGMAARGAGCEEVPANGRRRQPPTILHHNLPPIVGITSCRGHTRAAREIPRGGQASSACEVASTAAFASSLGRSNGCVHSRNECGDDESAATNPVSERRESVASGRNREDEEGVVEVSSSSSSSKPNNAEYSFSVAEGYHRRAAASPSRCQTSFSRGVAALGNSAGSTEEPCPASFAGCPSPSLGGRAAPSPHFVPPSSASMPCGTVHSSSDTPGISASPRSNLPPSPSPTPSNRPFSCHLKMSSFAEGSRPPTCLRSNNIQPSPRCVAPSFSHVSNSQPSKHLASANGSGLVNPSAQGVHSLPDPGRSRLFNESVEGVETFKDLSRPKNQPNQNSTLDLPRSNHFPISSSATQQPHQPSDSQSCINPFDVPSPKSFSQNHSHLRHQHQQQPSPQPQQIQQLYHHHYSPQQQQKVQHQQQLQHQQRYSTFGDYSNVVKPSHSIPKNPSPVSGELQRPSRNDFYSPQHLKQANADANGREFDDLCDEPNNIPINSQPRNSLGKEVHAAEYCQSEGSARIGTANSTHNDVHRGNHFKEAEMAGLKSNDVVKDGAWNDPGSDAEVVGCANVRNLNVNKMNGSECADRSISDSGGYRDHVRHGFQSPETPARNHFKSDMKNNCGLDPGRPGNSLGLRFPPVPQSNYDLNRQIYDSMTGGNGVTQPSHPPPPPLPPPQTRPLQKNSQQLNSAREQANAPTTLHEQCRPHHRDFSEQDRAKGLNRVAGSMKRVEYSSPGKNFDLSRQDFRPNSYGHFQGRVTGSHDAYHGNGQSVTRISPNPGFCSVALDHRHVAPSNSAIDPGRLALPQTSGRCVLPERMRASQPENRGGVLLADRDETKMADDEKGIGPAGLGCSQNGHNAIASSQSEGKVASPATVHPRPRRESPLDLSVKTVRQSADSTAKDDGDACFQNYRNAIRPPPYSESRFPTAQPNDSSSSPSSSSSSAGAPKIDFTPNFSDFNIDNSRPATPLKHHVKSDVPVLPPVECFKKFSGKSIAPATTRGSNGKCEFFAPKKPQPFPGRTNSAVEPVKMESQKRYADEFVRSDSSQAKIPRMDSWKVAFDRQIEQRLNSARISFQANLNAERGSNGVDARTSSECKNPSGASHYRGANTYPQTPVQTSAAPYNPAYSVRQPQCQPATPQTPQDKSEQLENVGHSPDPEQIIKQISKGVMPDYKLLQDKNVLSILRSSLEEKEAKLMQLREAARRKEKCRESMPSESTKSTREIPTKCQSHGKQSLPSFGAMALERMCAPPSFPGHKLNLPRSVDAVKIDVEPIQKYLSLKEVEKSGIPNADLCPQDDAQGPPTDLDGLAAFLAARIRTKGELKEVGPALNAERQVSNDRPKPGSSVTSSEESSSDRSLSLFHRTLKSPTSIASSGNPPKLVRESRLMTPLRRRLFGGHAEEEGPATSTSGQFNECSTLPPRDPNGIRSSSETSVFDFRESDSEGEMPVLERQTLEEMRRDRKIFGSKQNVSTILADETMEADKSEAIADLDGSHSDPFWDAAFDMFVEQLEKRPPKRSAKKKRGFGRTSIAGSETDLSNESSKVTSNAEKDATFEENEKPRAEISGERIRTEVEKDGKEVRTETVPDGHVKLSSSRLKSYRDDMMKSNGMSEATREDKREKLNGGAENSVAEEMEKAESESVAVESTEKSEGPQKKIRTEKAKKDESVIKTRGKSKKETEIADFASDAEGRDPRSESESTADDDDDSLSFSGLESESTDSETSQESSNSNYTSCDDSESERLFKRRPRMQTRLQTRSSKQKQTKSTGMRLRSKAVSLPVATPRSGKKKRKRKEEDCYPCGKKKKPAFGDGSHFRPGWEEECYKFKQQLRMPEKLISISRPPKRSSVSLPDLDPYRNSPSLDSSDATVDRRPVVSGKTNGDSDESDRDCRGDKFRGRRDSSPAPDNLSTSLLKLRNGKKSRSNSILNALAKKYGKPKSHKRQGELKAANERKSPRKSTGTTDKPEIVPAPSFGIGKENVLNSKRRSKDGGRKKIEEPDSLYSNYFRRKTVDKLKEAFGRNRVGGLISQEPNQVARLKCRTRTQAKRATLIEVFGEERPASAPPLSRLEDGTDREKVADKSGKSTRVAKKGCGGPMVTRGRGKVTRSGRAGLRSTAMLRSNKALQISKRHLNSGRKRNIDLLRMRAMASKKFSYHLVSSSDASNQSPMVKKRLKLRSVRRKFRSGFDYIRKKKKLKKDGDSVEGSVKERKLPSRPTSESVEDVQNEIKNWVMNKGLGETILHRAARLGYTDVAAYCLEKMDCSPSPRDNAGYTPLHEACSRGHLEIAKLLLMYGASVSESAKGGIRPLHEAAENGFTELIRLLLSFGADPLLETYTGHTALSLVADEEARRLIQHHLADVQGNVAPVWTFQGPSSLFDPVDSGCDPLCEPPSPEAAGSEYELEISDAMLPPLYRLTADEDSDRHWILMRDLVSYVGAKSKEAVLKELEASSVREMNLSDFNEQGKCCDLLLNSVEKSSMKSSKVLLVAYDDRIRRLLDVEKVSL